MADTPEATTVAVLAAALHDHHSSTSVALRSLADHGYGLIPSSVMDQANDEIRTRQAKIARLRAALKSMLDLWDDAALDPDDVDRDVLIPARAALAEGDER